MWPPFGGIRMEGGTNGNTGFLVVMSFVRFDKVSKSFAGQPVLEAVDFRVEEGEKVGLIGRNGTGKTTVLRLITGEMEPESGVIERMRKARTAHLAQMPQVDSAATVLDIVLAAFRDLAEMEVELSHLEERMAKDHDETVLKRYSALQDEFTVRGGYEFRNEVKRVLTGLGFGEADFERPITALSGGQTTRLMLALVLLQDADMLLLDEPENHLDIDAREWVEEYLKSCPKAVVIISHDRRMLNAVTERIIEVERGQLFNYTGNYDQYVGQKALVREQQQKTYERQQEFIRKEESWIDRFRYKNTKATQVQSRVKRLEKLDRVEAPPPEAAETRIRFGEVVRSGQVVVDAANLSMAYGPLKLYSGFNVQIERGERIGIIGPNGAGKTTLLRHFAGRLDGGKGEVRIGHKVALGFYEQRHENLNPVNDILGEIGASRPDMRPEQIRTFMGHFLFTGDDIFKPIGALSGGELSRVAIAKLILSNANVLLLDEPTNHLDIASREALESALTDYPGTLIMVSHDRALIDRFAERLIVVEHGRATVHLGNYTDYRWKQSQLAQQAAEEAARQAAKSRAPKYRPDRTEEN
ncbi:MAG: ATP-binding cassette, subfamily er 3, partial [Candidatus Hydrogenedentes bacterium]|nr:ATP-binding cassette, subfamily er 3 [Candidatus Hydrogenedentota bacterium]